MMNCQCNCNQNNQNQTDLLNQIRNINFSIIELGLYLDTHPEDQIAIALHNRRANELRILTDNYQKMYGPLSIDCPCNMWRWIEEPWPWEEGGN